MPPPADYRPYTPLYRLKPVDRDIWIVDGPVVQWGYLGWRFPFPTRMTVIRLPDGGLWLHSPVQPEARLLAAIEELGPVSHLVSPNAIHHLSITAWAELYPDARVWASPGVRKRSKARFTDDLKDQAAVEWQDVIDQRIARGSPALEEVVFFHKPSRTLILTDLIENFEAGRLHRACYRTMARLAGIRAPNGKTPIDWRLTFFGNRPKLRTTIRWMIACRPKRIIIAHGAWFKTDAIGQLKRAFSWVGGID